MFKEMKSRVLAFLFVILCGVTFAQTGGLEPAFNYPQPIITGDGNATAAIALSINGQPVNEDNFTYVDDNGNTYFRYEFAGFTSDGVCRMREFVKKLSLIHI